MHLNSHSRPDIYAHAKHEQCSAKFTTLRVSLRHMCGWTPESLSQFYSLAANTFSPLQTTLIYPGTWPFVYVLQLMTRLLSIGLVGREGILRINKQQAVHLRSITTHHQCAKQGAHHSLVCAHHWQLQDMGTLTPHHPPHNLQFVMVLCLKDFCCACRAEEDILIQCLWAEINWRLRRFPLCKKKKDILMQPLHCKCLGNYRPHVQFFPRQVGCW
jgi:hypothetical protein